MEKTCSQCSRSFNRPDDRTGAFQTPAAFLCPECRQPAGLDGDPAGRKAEDVTGTGSLAGDALKKQVLASVRALPSMSRVVHKARRVLADPDADFEDVARVIEADQAIAATVLRLANSAYYGSMNAVSSVRRAAVVLGTRNLMEMLNLACCAGTIGRKLPGYDLDAGDLWRHSLAVAAGAKLIALEKRPELAEAAFTAGLIHDVGKVVLDPFVLERKGAFEAFVRNGRAAFIEAEKEVLGFDHGELAAEICQQWRIPADLARAIQHHHQPANTGGDFLANILHAADGVALLTGLGGGLDGMLYRIEPAVLRQLQFDQADLSRLLSAVVDYVAKTAADMD